MSPSSAADEADLHAFADGQLPPDRIPAMEARLAADPVARAEVCSWREQNELIVQLYDGGVELTFPRLRLDMLLRDRWLGMRRVVAAAVAASVIGFGGGWFAHDSQRTTLNTLDSFARLGVDLHDMTARGELRSPIENDVGKLRTQLSQALAHEIQVPDLGLVGLHLVGGRALPIAAGKTAAQLIYTDPSGTRFTLYFVRPEPRAAAGFQPLSDAAVAGLVWPYEEFHCLLLGDAPRTRLLEISQAVQAQLDADDSPAGRSNSI